MIRIAKVTDLDTIYKMGRALHDNYKQTYDLESLLTKDYFHLLVYEKENQVIGFLAYSLLIDSVDILDIYVDKEYRQQKIASLLIDYMISMVDPKTSFLLEVAVDSLPAISLYEKFGFKVIHTRKKYYGQKDAYVMEREALNE